MQGDDGGISNGLEGQANHVPVNLLPLGVQILQGELLFLLYLVRCARRAFSLATVEPAHRGIVIVRAGIDDAVAGEIVRLIVVGFGVVAEGELQHPHAGETETIAEGFDLRRDDA